MMIRVVLLLAFGLSSGFSAERDAKWAVKVEQTGLPNLHRVCDGVYRCAQPSADGLKAAEKLGIKTVINLRAFNSDKDEAKSTGLKREHIRFYTWDVEEDEVVRFLKLVANTNSGPFLIHCKHGADRTGTMVAVYRMAIQGWKKEEAIKEMKEGGYGYHSIWSNLPRYLNKLDVEALRKKAGIVAPEP
jgi:protein tyrosine/serine phosphatase